MTTNTRSESRQRTMLVGVRLKPDEHVALVAMAAKRRITAPSMLRRLLLYRIWDERATLRNAEGEHP